MSHGKNLAQILIILNLKKLRISPRHGFFKNLFLQAEKGEETMIHQQE